MLASLHPRPFCLHLEDRDLAPCILAPCVYMQRKRQEASKRAMEEERCIDNSKRAQNEQAK